MKREAFTMIEIVFVIVILGILAAVAIPKLTATRTDAQVSKAISDISSIRSSIVSERQSRLLTGDSNYINRLDAGVAVDTEGVKLFDNNGTTSNEILMYGITTKDTDGHWMKRSATTYAFILEGADNIMTYNSSNGTFTCTSGAYCTQLNP
jgi:general secretion pathway protein G